MKVLSLGMMGENIKEVILMTKNKDMVNLNGMV